VWLGDDLELGGIRWTKRTRTQARTSYGELRQLGRQGDQARGTSNLEMQGQGGLSANDESQLRIVLYIRNKGRCVAGSHRCVDRPQDQSQN
jgi:hypothetical protein